MHETYPHRPGWKGTETSRLAAEAVAATDKPLMDKCEDIFRICWPEGLTADEVAEVLGKSILSIRPRISQLKQLNIIFATGERRLTASGQRADVLRMIDEEV